jgi:splicing factor U2AF 65 kDa subunit
LTNTISVLERKRRLTQWDIKPPGYENVTAEQAKLSGMFPLPGAPRQQAMDPTKLQAFMNNPSGSVNSAALKPTNSRQSKRLFITNLPPSVTEDGLLNFLNLQLNGLNVIESTDPCVLCQINAEKTFALVEFRNSSEATVALAFDGISMEAEDTSNGHGPGGGLTIRRPKDYIVPAVVDDTGYEPGVLSSRVTDTPNKLSIANIPAYLTEEQVTELLVSFGELKAFVLVKDSGTDESRVSLLDANCPILPNNCRVLHSANTQSPSQPRWQSMVSKIWSLETSGFAYARPALVSRRSLALRWASMPCRCLQGQRLPIRKLRRFCSC